MNDPSVASTALASPLDPSLVTYTHVIYALHALSVLIGITSAAAIITAFIFGLPSIIAVIMNYVRQSAVRGSFLESHFRWQIRTFWYAVLWILIVVIVSAPFMLVLVGFVMLWAGAGIVGLWVMYRVIRGWLALRDGRPMYAGS
jgi:uncharacterized membrane protein